MSTKTKTVTTTTDYFPPPDWIAELFPECRYFGPCIVQAPQAWTRMGPAWRHRDGSWIVLGSGVRYWGTTKGLAELAAEATAKPEWHAIGWSIVPAPPLVFLIEPEALAKYERIAGLAAQADAWIRSTTTN